MDHREAWSAYLPLSNPILEQPPWSLSRSTMWVRIVAAALVVSSIAASVRLLGHLVSEDNDMLAFLGALIGVSLYLGKIPAWVSCWLSLGFLSFGHGHSGFSLTSNGVQVFLSFGLFLFTTHQVATLADRTRRETWRSRQKAQVMEWLQEFSQDCSSLTDPAKVNTLLDDFSRVRLKLEAGVQPQGSEQERAFWEEVVGELQMISREALGRIEQTESEQRTAVLEATQKLQSTLIDSLSHDLQTPLSSVSGALEMLKDSQTDLSPESRGQLTELAYTQTNRLINLVRNVLNLAKLQGGGLKLSAKQVPVASLIPGVLAQFDARSIHRIKVSQTEEAEQVWVSGDRTLLTQVLFNLLDNALKFSPEESEVKVAMESRGADIVIAVTDQGFGIEANEHSLVFERFFRGTTQKRVPGSGLGLYLCHQLIDLHQGRIEMTSQVGQGSRFEVVLPKFSSDEVLS